VIAVGGMFGTLSEIAVALKIGRPVIGLGTWRLAQPQGRRVPIIRAPTPEAAVTLAIRAARNARGSRRWLS
jgi:predicted Rossmann-fold nucleotide-binding protein